MYDLTIRETEPRVGLRAGRGACLEFSLSALLLSCVFPLKHLKNALRLYSEDQVSIFIQGKRIL